MKASNTGAKDFFGYSLSLIGDGNTLVVGAYAEDSDMRGIENNPVNHEREDSGWISGIGNWTKGVLGIGQESNDGEDSGAAYIFLRSGEV